MNIEEYKNWYIENKGWMEYKAHYLLSSIKWDYNEVNELVSITNAFLLENLDKIRPETLNSYCFFVMRNSMFNHIVYPKTKICCEADFKDFSVKDEEYSIEEDNLAENRLKMLENRVENEIDSLVLTTLISGGKLNELKPRFTNYQINKAVTKIKGRENMRREYKGVAKLDSEGNILKVYESIGCVEIDGFRRGVVSKCCNGTKKQYKGYKFAYLKNLKLKRNENQSKTS